MGRCQQYQGKPEVSSKSAIKSDLEPGLFNFSPSPPTSTWGVAHFTLAPDYLWAELQGLLYVNRHGSSLDQHHRQGNPPKTQP